MSSFMTNLTFSALSSRLLNDSVDELKTLAYDGCGQGDAGCSRAALYFVILIHLPLLIRWLCLQWSEILLP